MTSEADKKLSDDYKAELIAQAKLANRAQNNSSEETKKREAKETFERLFEEINKYNLDTLTAAQGLVYTKTITTVRTFIIPGRQLNFKQITFANTTFTIPEELAKPAFALALSTLTSIYT